MRGELFNSTDHMSEELFHSPTSNAMDSESDDGDDKEFALDDGIFLNI